MGRGVAGSWRWSLAVQTEGAGGKPAGNPPSRQRRIRHLTQSPTCAFEQDRASRFRAWPSRKTPGSQQAQHHQPSRQISQQLPVNTVDAAARVGTRAGVLSKRAGFVVKGQANAVLWRNCTIPQKNHTSQSHAALWSVSCWRAHSTDLKETGAGPRPARPSSHLAADDCPVMPTP